ncbi:MAG: hypothetical protein K2X69_12245 [Silvanigrellaceae bacterium]|nr:hypothetical protein [Silvanigrellaceae bacterium]
MKRILYYGDSNVWGFVPGSFNSETKLAKRHKKNQLWTTILQNKLGDDYEVFSDGINGRTTDLDEMNPGRSFRNGFALLGCSLEIHYPINLIILWLGTNDTKKQFNRAAIEIKKGLQKIVTLIKESLSGQNACAPKILIICPPPITENLHPEFNDDAIKKSKELSKLYYDLSIEMQCEFLDAGLSIQSSVIDGIHLDSNSCYIIGNRIAEKLNLMSI